MIKHYITIAWRNLKRRKTLSFIQVLCLAIGLAAFILIARFIQYENNWDKFNENYNRIYRVQSYKMDDRSNDYNQIPAPVANHIYENYSYVDNAILLSEIWSEYLSVEKGSVYHEKDGFWAPSDVFKIFSFKLISGDVGTVLDLPNSIVLSESMAKKLFPNSNAMGQFVYDSQKNELVVTGLMEDIPEQSHINASYFRSNANVLKKFGENWYHSSFTTYVLLKKNASLETLDEQIKNVVNEHDLTANRYLYLNPLSTLHLKENPKDDRGVVIYFFSFIAIMTLLLSCLSFMNLSNSFASLRMTEIGVRKAMGSSRSYLRIQFLTESTFIAFVALILAVFLAYFLLPTFNQIVGRNIELFIFRDLAFSFFLLVVTFVTGILSGLYPAFIVASFDAVTVLKGKFVVKKRGISGLQVMVYAQFVLSVILITSSLWVYRQVDFLINKDLGFSKDNLLHSNLPPQPDSKVSYQTIRADILSYPGIKNMSLSHNSPLHIKYGCYAIPEGGDKNNPIFARWNDVCPDFFNTMDLQLLAGRNFYPDSEADMDKCIINEKAAKAFGYDNPIGRTIEVEGKHTIIGVVEEFIFEDVHNPIVPCIMFLHDRNFSSQCDLNFNIQANDKKGSLDHISNVLNKHFPDVLFNVDEYDAFTNRLEIKIWNNAKNTFAFFTVLAVIIASLGLFGLVFFSMQRRIKEIGVRKVQGARIQQIIPLITKRYLVMAMASNIIIYPVAKFIQNILPGQFKYQFTLLDVLIVCAVTILVTLLSSLYQAIRAANLNPIKALRYE